MTVFWKKIFFVITVSLVFLTTDLCFAQSNKYGTVTVQKATDGSLPTSIAGGTNVNEVIGGIIQAALTLIGIVFFLIILYAGFNWMTARGNAEIADKSKDTITSAAIGLIIVMAAYAITSFIFTSLKTTSTIATDKRCLDAGGTCGSPDRCAPEKRQSLCPGAPANTCCLP